MRQLGIVIALFSTLCWAQAVDGGVDGGVSTIAIDAGMPLLLTVNAGTPSTLPLPDVSILAQNVLSAVVLGDWWGAAAGALVVLVLVLRKYGKKIHAALDDKNPLDKLFWFFFDTKVGGWLLNLLTAVACGVGTTIAAGQKVTWALVKPILLVAVTGAALWEAIKDVQEWLAAKRTPKPISDTMPTPPGGPALEVRAGAPAPDILAGVPPKDK